MTARASNTNAVQSAVAAAGQVGNDCTHISVWSALTGGSLLWAGTINTNPDALALGGRFQIAAGALVFEYTKGTGETDAMELRGAAGKVRGGVWVQYHTGAPGTAGTSNVIGLARTPIAESAFTTATV